MLETLRIQNYALIDEIEVEFRPGLNALTGETGAGKSIIIGALNLVLGARASSDAVREGQRQARVDAAFRLDQPSARLRALLEDQGLELDDGRLLLSRVVGTDARSKAYAGGSMVPVGTLGAIGDELVDLHGQHEHQSLLHVDRQLDLLDTYVTGEALLAEVQQHVRRLRALEKEAAELESVDRERERHLEFLRFEAGEIDQAGLEAGEEDELQTRRNLLTNAERIATLAGQAHGMLYENDGAAAVDAIGTALGALEELAAIDDRFRPLVDQLEQARSETEAVAGELRGYAAEVEVDPEELDTLNRRLNLIAELKRKYGDTVEAVLAYRDQAAGELAQYERRDERLAEVRRELEAVTRDAASAAGRLTALRKKGASRLEKAVTQGLQDLGMKGARFEIGFETVGLTLHGADRIEFMLAANPGERLKPLRQVASGGEFSRVMLAIKTVLAAADAIQTLVFDEIDAGVGGAVASMVGARLRELAASHQVFCITHLPQIAAAADTHFHVAKASRKGRTATTLRRIENEGRVEEVARLLDGSVSAVSLEHARALLETGA